MAVFGIGFKHILAEKLGALIGMFNVKTALT